MVEIEDQGGNLEVVELGANVSHRFFGGPQTMSQVIALGEDTPDYDDQLFFWSILYDF